MSDSTSSGGRPVALSQRKDSEGIGHVMAQHVLAMLQVQGKDISLESNSMR